MKKYILLALALLGTSSLSYAAKPTKAKAVAVKLASAQDNKVAEEEPVKAIDAAYLREHIYDYKANPNKFVFKGKRPAVIDFWASWCGPCRALAPKVAAAAKKYAGKIDFYKVNVDANQELSKIFGVRSIPMLLFIPTEGTPTQTVGNLSPEQIEEAIAEIYKAK